MSAQRIQATVRRWDDEEGWGVVDAPEAPGGIFVHFSGVEGDGYRSLTAGQIVELDRGWRVRVVGANGV